MTNNRKRENVEFDSEGFLKSPQLHDAEIMHFNFDAKANRSLEFHVLFGKDHEFFIRFSGVYGFVTQAIATQNVINDLYLIEGEDLKSMVDEGGSEFGISNVQEKEELLYALSTRDLKCLGIRSSAGMIAMILYSDIEIFKTE